MYPGMILIPNCCIAFIVLIIALTWGLFPNRFITFVDMFSMPIKTADSPTSTKCENNS